MSREDDVNTVRMYSTVRTNARPSFVIPSLPARVQAGRALAILSLQMLTAEVFKLL